MNVSQAFKSRSMKSMLGDHLLRNGLSRLSYDNPRKTSTLKLLPAPSSSSPQIDKSLITTSKTHKVDSLFTTMNKLVKGKLSIVGGVNKLFRKIFSVREGEKLLRTAHCCLSTTAGPISGRLFISTEKLAFCSDRPIAKVTSPNGDKPLRFHYKIVIPLGKIKNLNERYDENLKKASQKYLQVVTSDEFEFCSWDSSIITKLLHAYNKLCPITSNMYFEFLKFSLSYTLIYFFNCIISLNYVTKSE